MSDEQIIGYVVLMEDYEASIRCGYFTELPAAEAYADELRRCEECRTGPDGEEPLYRVRISPCKVRPRRQLRGGYEVEIDALGRVVRGDWTAYAEPDMPNWTDGESAHWWVGGPEGKRRTTDRGAVIRARGIDRSEALHRARALLAAG